MSSSKPNPRPRRRATTQTIEQIEARAEAIRQAEDDTMVGLAAYLRDRAVELPVESTMPVKFAKAANAIDLFAGRDSQLPWLGFRDVSTVIDEWGRERCEDLLERLAEILGREVS